MKKIVAGNWKMFGLQASQAELQKLNTMLLERPSACDVYICPPATLVASFAQNAGQVVIGGQDCHALHEGAYTGNISAPMLKDAGANVVILGHSERRTLHGETNEIVKAKAQAAVKNELQPIVCIGETLQQREQGQELGVITDQLAHSVPDSIGEAGLVVAYEPVWAIGTGKIPTLEQIGEMHSHIREQLTVKYGAETAQKIAILYGGSVKPNNAADIFAVKNVDGALVGGASLKADDFSQIIYAC